MLKSYTVKIITSNRLPENAITISSALRKLSGVNPGQQIIFIFGSRKISATIMNYHNSGSELSIYFGKKISNTLLLPPSTAINLLVNTSKSTWRLGPLIGIFANRFDKKNKPFGEQTNFFRKLSKEAKKLNSYLFVFSPGDIDWANKAINGSIPKNPEDSSSEWKNLTFPFPDVIYDRGLFPKGPKRARATQARKILRNYPGLKFFNPAFFGKWKTHKLLSKHEILINHLPDTKLYSSGKDVSQMLRKYGSLYLKPSGGSSGKGIMKLSLNGQEKVLKYRYLKQVHTLQFKDFEQMNLRLNSVIGDKRYIVQQAINLSCINECPFDIRVIMQRDINGQWKRTGMAARVAQKGNFLSNIHAGGHAAKITDVLKTIFSSRQQVELILNNIRRVCSLAAAWVSTEGNPLFGEFAIDLGIDQSGMVWIIELNAIPGRSVFRKIKAGEIAKKALARPIEYAYYLSGFNLSANVRAKK